MRAVRIPAVALATLVILCFATVASATVVGDLKLDAGNGSVTVTLSSITFNTDTSSDPPGPPWNAQVTNTTVLMFAGCPSGVLGAAGCLDSGAFTPSEAAEIANNNPIVAGAGLAPNNPFIQFAGNGVSHATILYTVTSLTPGSSNTNCTALVNIGDSCSVFAGSPFVLTLTATGTNVSLGAVGTVTDGAGSSNWIGQFSEPITGMTPGQIQLFFCPSGTCQPADFTSGRSIVKPWSGDFLASTVPEPGTTALTLIGGGLIGFAALKRRKSKKA